MKLTIEEEAAILKMREKAKEKAEKAKARKIKKVGVLKENCYANHNQILSAAERDEQIQTIIDQYHLLPAGTQFKSRYEPYYGEIWGSGDYHSYDANWAKNNLIDIKELPVEPKKKKGK
jgi:hypothetical protein